MAHLALFLAIAFFIAGIAGILLPVLPGHPIIWLGMFLYGLLTGFHRVTWAFLFVQAILVAVAFGLDYLGNIWGVRRYGGSRVAVLGGAAGLLLGALFFGPVGILLGPFVGASLGELLAGRPLPQAFRVGLGTLIGLLGGTALKLCLAAGMIGWFFVTIW